MRLEDEGVNGLSRGWTCCKSQCDQVCHLLLVFSAYHRGTAKPSAELSLPPLPELGAKTNLSFLAYHLQVVRVTHVH